MEFSEGGPGKGRPHAPGRERSLPRPGRHARDVLVAAGKSANRTRGKIVRSRCSHDGVGPSFSHASQHPQLEGHYPRAESGGNGLVDLEGLDLFEGAGDIV